MKGKKRTTPGREKVVEMYTQMLTIRLFEEGYEQLYLKGKMPGWAHLSIGQEAVAVGVCSALKKHDYIVSTHRGHGHCIAKGCEMKYMMAELFGKATGYCKGKGGSMHIANFEINMLGANGIVGGGLPIACGAGLSVKIKKTDQVVVCFFGDGAGAQGAFHESLNLASLWRLPVIFLAENNQYAEYAFFEGHTAVQDIAQRAVGYSIPGVVVDGMDVLEIYQATMTAVERARKGEGPTLLECKTYRFRGHFIGDLGGYQPEGEIEEWKKRDPIKLLNKYILDRRYLTIKEFKKIKTKIEEEFRKAVAFAEKSPFPDLDETERDVYSSEY
jgi:pyruvate dehydrogenase E1 component alpha subunit